MPRRSLLGLLNRAEVLYAQGEIDAALRLFHEVGTAPEVGPRQRARAFAGSGSCWEVLGRSGSAVDDWSLALRYASRVAGDGDPLIVNIRRWLDSHARLPRVFISYARLDGQAARRVHSALERSGAELVVVRDERAFRAGGAVQDEIDDHLARCNFYLVLWSRRFAARPFTTYEVECILKLMAPARRAFRSERRVLLVRLDDTELPRGWPELLYVDARGRSTAWLVEQVLRALGRPAT